MAHVEQLYESILTNAYSDAELYWQMHFDMPEGMEHLNLSELQSSNTTTTTTVTTTTITWTFSESTTSEHSTFGWHYHGEWDWGEERPVRGADTESDSDEDPSCEVDSDVDISADINHEAVAQFAAGYLYGSTHRRVDMRDYLVGRSWETPP